MQVTDNQASSQDDEPRVTVWKSFNSKDNTELITLDEVRQIIADEKRSEQLMKLASLTKGEVLNFHLNSVPGVVFGGQVVAIEGQQRIGVFSGYFCIPIRAAKDRLAVLRPLIESSSFVCLCFCSLTNDGVNIVLQTERTPTSNEEYQSYYEAGVSILQLKFNLSDDELSSINSKPTASCYLSFDPDVYSDTFPPEIPGATTPEEPPMTQFVDDIEQSAAKASHSSILGDLTVERQRAEQEVNEQGKTAGESTDQPEVKTRGGIIRLRTNETAIDLWTWEYNHREKEWIIAGLYRTGIYSYLESQGFAKRYRPDGATTFLIQGTTVIEPVIDTVMRDSLKAYIEADPTPIILEDVSATYESRLEIYNRQQHLTINSKGLEGLNTHTLPMLRDTETICYVPYRNGIVQVTAQAVTVQPYSILKNLCVWKSQVLNRDYDPQANGENSHFARFVFNIANGEPDRLRAFRSTIGYLIHHHGNPAEGQAIICYDEEITDARKPEGGTGKGLFGNSVRQVRPVAVIDGKKFDQNDRFNFQQVNQDTAVVWIDDPVVNHPKAERRFTLERFFSTLTEGWVIEKKHEHAFRIPAKEGPKLLISSNVVMPNEGSSNIRRQFILEFSNHYKKQIRNGNEKPIQAEHGCVFFSDDWNVEEWQRFDSYMIGCVREYMREGLQPYKLRSADKNRLRQMAGEDFYEWVTKYGGSGLISGREYNRDELFRDYKMYAGLSDAQATTRGFTNNITQYAKSKDWKYERGPDQRNVVFSLTPL